MKRGTLVKLSQKGLEWIYKNIAWRDRARGYRYIFWGYPRDEFERKNGIVRVKRTTSHSFLTFHKDFLEVANN